MHRVFSASILLLSLVRLGSAQESSAAQRGEQAIKTRAFTPAPWKLTAYQDLWKVWEPKPESPPEDYPRAIQDRYGLPAAPYVNGKLPLGLREGTFLFTKGITSDCMICHGGALLGKSYVGLGNASLDIQGLFEDLAKASQRPSKLPFTFSQVRGTSEAGSMAVFLLSYREPDLSIRLNRHPFSLHDSMCEDVPAWWLLKKKKTMYYTGTSDARSVRSIMQFMLAPTNPRSTFEKEESTFADIQAYLLSLEPPRYPFKIDEKLAQKGKGLFEEHCARCHGTYGNEATYPNKIIPLDVIGTDRARFDGIAKEVGDLYNQSWFAKEKENGYQVTEPIGYQAPPLDGIWATAPYFHNGSVPTLADVLDSKQRPVRFTRSYRTDAVDYDTTKLGWKVQPLPKLSPEPLTPHHRRQIYDTTQPGRGNAGHTFGDRLHPDERQALLEYLKKL